MAAFGIHFGIVMGNLCFWPLFLWCSQLRGWVWVLGMVCRYCGDCRLSKIGTGLTVCTALRIRKYLGIFLLALLSCFLAFLASICEWGFV